MRLQFALVLLLAALGGCGVPWTTLAQSGPPSALAVAARVGVAYDFSQLVIDGQPVEQFMANVGPEEAADVDGVLAGMQPNFVGEMASRSPLPVFMADGPPSADEARLVVQYTLVQRGTRGPIGFVDTQVSARLLFSPGAGAATDIIEVTRSSSPSLTRPSIAQRMDICNRAIARIAGRFLESELSR